jgi:uncharacterized protein
MKPCYSERLRLAVLVSTFLLSGARTYAQSFDCKKASTTIEHAICDHKTLRELDTELADELKDSTSNVTPEQRRDFVWAERRWIAYRDNHCAQASLPAGPHQ